MLLSNEEIEAIGFRSVGKDVRITRYALFFNPSRISIGDRSRIDAFAIVAAGDDGVEIGKNVHIAAHALINGSGGKVILDDFSGISTNVCLWTASDDYTQGSLTGGTIPAKWKKNHTGPITIGRHVIVGSGSVILPGLTLNDGAAVGALSMVNRDLSVGSVVVGCPAREIKKRPIEKLRAEEQKYLSSLNEQ